MKGSVLNFTFVLLVSAIAHCTLIGQGGNLADQACDLNDNSFPCGAEVFEIDRTFKGIVNNVFIFKGEEGSPEVGNYHNTVFHVNGKRYDRTKPIGFEFKGLGIKSEDQTVSRGEEKLVGGPRSKTLSIFYYTYEGSGDSRRKISSKFTFHPGVHKMVYSMPMLWDPETNPAPYETVIGVIALDDYAQSEYIEHFSDPPSVPRSVLLGVRIKVTDTTDFNPMLALVNSDRSTFVNNLVKVENMDQFKWNEDMFQPHLGKIEQFFLDFPAMKSHLDIFIDRNGDYFRNIQPRVGSRKLKSADVLEQMKEKLEDLIEREIAELNVFGVSPAKSGGQLEDSSWSKNKLKILK